MALKLKGYHLEIVSDPVKGIEMLKNDPDIILVLLDVNMPGKSGVDVCGEIRQCWPVPILFMTGHVRTFNAQSEQMVRLWQTQFAEGTTDIIYKPFNIQFLLDKVEGLVGVPEATEPTA